MKRSILRLGIALTALLFAGGALAETAKKPELKLTTLEGQTFDLAALNGKWVIVNFWATWCSPCIKEMPDISHLVESRPDVTAIGLAFGDEEVADVQAFLKKHPVKYPVANVREGLDIPLAEIFPAPERSQIKNAAAPLAAEPTEPA